MTSLYFRLGAMVAMLTMTACSPSIEEVQKQVRADLEQTYKSTNLKVASLALKEVDDGYEGSLETNEKGGSFSYTIKVSKNGDKFESTALPTGKSVERKLITLMNGKLAEFDRQVIKLDIISKDGNNYSGHATVQEITSGADPDPFDPDYTETTCSFSGTLQSISNFSYKFSFSKRDVQQSVDDYMYRRLYDGRSVYNIETRISKVTASQYTGAFDAEGVSFNRYVDQPIDVYLDDQDCSIVLKGDFSGF